MKVYMDYASTTYVDPRVLEKMLPYFTEKYGNAGSMHELGYEAKIAVDNARKVIAGILNCRRDEIIFTGSGTEANNLAILGTARANKEKGSHIITLKTEHPSILEPLKYLEEKEGFEVSYLDSPEELENAIREDTILVSIIYANNEIGSIEDISKAGEICKRKGVYFHTDACQAANYLPLDTEKLNLDMMTLNAGKIYGPKGIGLLYKKKSVEIEPIIFGGGQEEGLRSGTVNTAAIVGFAEALKITEEMKETESKRLINLRDKLIDGILKKIPSSELNGRRENRLPNNINIYIPKIDNKELILQLDAAGIYASTGSACSSGKTTPSQVLTAIGIPEEKISGSIRLSLGRRSSEEDISYFLEAIGKILA